MIFREKNEKMFFLGFSFGFLGGKFLRFELALPFLAAAEMKHSIQDLLTF